MDNTPNKVEDLDLVSDMRSVIAQLLKHFPKTCREIAIGCPQCDAELTRAYLERMICLIE